MEHTTSVDDADEFEKGDVYSKSKEGDNISVEHESDCSASECSLSSGSEDDDHHEDAIPCSKLAAGIMEILQADESSDTTWTDEKHSSYLDSMEATFVRKMYDKEYCSVDVCGHTSHSSITVEQDCVESRPLYLNMRKPYEQAIGLLPFRAFLGSSSVLASPWIQHFKSKQSMLPKKSEAHKNSNRTERSCPYISKKREAFIDAADCNPSPRSSHGITAGGFKKLKSEQDLSHMDMKMEERYNAEQQIQDSHQQVQQGKPHSGKTQELTKQEAGCFETGESEKATKVKELKETPVIAVDSGISASMLNEALPLKKCDQRVPSSNDDGKETCGQNVVPDTTLSSEQGCSTCDIDVDKKDGLSDHEKVTTQSGSKTWAWDGRGRRHRTC